MNNTKIYFIPAQQLEHPSNPEILTLTEKIRLALSRVFSRSDIVIFSHQFNNKDFGYDVWASITP